MNRQVDLKLWHLLLSTALLIGSNYGMVKTKLDRLDSTEERVFILERQLATTSTSSQKDIEHLNEFKDEMKIEFKEFKEEMKIEFKEQGKSQDKRFDEINKSFLAPLMISSRRFSSSPSLTLIIISTLPSGLIT
jgi:hypothetical protein